MLALLLTTMVPPLAAQDGAQAHDSLTVFRCVDADGSVALRDSPCDASQAQQTRQVQRPMDPPAPPPAIPAVAAEPAPEPVPVVVHVPALQPMYECVTPDGERYLSDSNQGNPRWVPLWTLGYPTTPGVAARGTSRPPASGLSTVGMAANISIPSGPSRLTPPPAATPPPVRPAPPRGRRHHGHGAAGGTWISDECVRLPQAEACARLTAEREEIRRRFFNAQPSERDVLRTQERDISARLAGDCRID